MSPRLAHFGHWREYGDDELFAALFNRERSSNDWLTPNDVAAVRVKAGKLLVYDGDRYGHFMIVFGCFGGRTKRSHNDIGHGTVRYPDRGYCFDATGALFLHISRQHSGEK